ncbi:hypothetical protein [Pseudomonas vancouverensis]|nr:hypothetical protein [Pseudomonas vancouverensis]
MSKSRRSFIYAVDLDSDPIISWTLIRLDRMPTTLGFQLETRFVDAEFLLLENDSIVE